MGLEVDSTSIRIVRASESDTPLVDAVVAYDSDTTSLGWIVTLRAEEEELRVELTVWDNDARAYAGDRTLVVRERDAITAEATVESVPVSYIGPPIVATVTVTPELVTLEALGATAALSAVARDRHGAVVTPAFTWTSSDPAVASVDAQSGVVTAVGNGTATVQAAAGAVHASSTIIAKQRVTMVTVTPASATLTAFGATQPFTAEARDGNGAVVSGRSFTWSSAPPGVATVDPALGVATASANGTATVQATVNGVSGSAELTVVQRVARVVVTPASASIVGLDVTKQFVAQAFDANDWTVSGSAFVWSSSDPGIARVDDKGLARSCGFGVVNIMATTGEVRGQAELTVKVPSSRFDLVSVGAAVIVLVCDH